MLNVLFGITLSASFFDLPSMVKRNMSVNFAYQCFFNQRSLFLPQMALKSHFEFRNLRLFRNIEPFLIAFAGCNELTISNSIFSHFLKPSIILQQALSVNLSNETFSTSSGMITKMQPVYFNIVNNVTIANCTFSNIIISSADNIFRGRGSGLSIRFGLGEFNSNFTSYINISSSNFLNCTNRVTPNNYGGAFYISSDQQHLNIYISDVNITGCNAFNGAAFVVDTPNKRSNLTIENIKIVKCSNIKIDTVQTHSVMINNSSVKFSYSYFKGTLFENNNISNHHFGFLNLENCIGQINGIQFDNVLFNVNNGVVIKVIGNNTNLTISNICFSNLAFPTYFGIQVVNDTITDADDKIRLIDFFYGNNFGVNYSYSGTNNTDGCNIEPNFTMTFTIPPEEEEDVTSDITNNIETSEDPISISLTDENQTTIETTSNVENNNNNNNVRPLSNNDIGAIIGGTIAGIIVIILIIVIVICCKKKGCTCCEKRAFKFSDDEESSHQELYFPNFDAK